HARQSTKAKRDPLVAAAIDAEDIGAWFSRLPWRRGHSPISAVPEYEDYILEQWTHGDFDDYWKKMGIYAAGWYDSFADVPTIIISSWYDPYPRTATENYVALSRRKKGPIRLVLGPWTHGNRSLTYSGDVDFGKEATLDGQLADNYDEYRLAWLDRHLKGSAGPADGEPAVRYFRMGGGGGRRNAEGRLDHGGAWRAACDWPLHGTRETDFFLGSDGRLVASTPPAVKASLSWLHDPSHPVPSIGGAITSGEPLMVGGAFDQVEAPRFHGSRPPFLPLASRADILVFETEPLAEEVEVTGAIVARLWISSDCPDTDVTIKLIDVHPPNADYPGGFAMNLTDGILRLRYRDSWEKPAFMEPGRIYEVLVETFPVSNLFARGHRIRLDVASSNFPRFDVNPNTGEPQGRSRLSRVATNTVHMDEAHPSRIVLPVIPADA
ncbi:MAG: CocE/NonD family hydrolase, partial [Spirochaetota bacterium]